MPNILDYCSLRVFFKFYFQDLDKRPHVVIATPGRLADHIENNSTFTLKNLKYLVLDEADRLLEGK